MMQKCIYISYYPSTNYVRIVAYHCEFMIPEREREKSSCNPCSSHHSTPHTNHDFMYRSLWINIGNLLLWEFIHPLIWMKLQC